jgi:hypothetical protein
MRNPYYEKKITSTPRATALHNEVAILRPGGSDTKGALWGERGKTLLDIDRTCSIAASFGIDLSEAESAALWADLESVRSLRPASRKKETELVAFLSGLERRQVNVDEVYDGPKGPPSLRWVR